MTDLQGKGRPGACVSAVNHALYFGWQNAVYELDLETLEERVVWEPSPGMRIRGRANPTADGKYVCMMLGEAPRQEGPARISFSYSNFRESFRAKPLTQIAAHVPWDIDAPRSVGPRRARFRLFQLAVIHEDRRYMGHVNTSPALPDILTYCHEGPWNCIDAARGVRGADVGPELQPHAS